MVGPRQDVGSLPAVVGNDPWPFTLASFICIRPWMLNANFLLRAELNEGGGRET